MPPSKEALQPSRIEIGIYDETDPLKTVILWGPPGVEAFITQLYPPEKSLFLEEMDVIKARGEALNLKEIFTKLGINVIEGRSILSSYLTEVSRPSEYPTSVKEAADNLLKIAERIAQENGQSLPPNAYETISTLLESDAELYGEEEALRLAAALNKIHFNYPLPLGNIMYSRDPANVLMESLFLGRMRYKTRRGEPSLYRLIFQKAGIDPQQIVTLPKGTTFEGGDAYIYRNTVFIGVHPRTSKEAVLYIARNLKEKYRSLNFQVAAVVLDEERSFEDNQRYMHLDTYSMPLDENNIIIDEEESNRRTVWIVENGQLTPTNLNFSQFLIQALQVNVIPIPPEEQQNFGLNFLVIDEDTVLIPLSNPTLCRVLESLGKRIINTNLTESTKGFGAAHCMTFQVLRSPEGPLNI